jgi:hypothetical protein
LRYMQCARSAIESVPIHHRAEIPEMPQLHIFILSPNPITMFGTNCATYWNAPSSTQYQLVKDGHCRPCRQLILHSRF